MLVYMRTQKFGNHVKGTGLQFASLLWCWQWQKCRGCGQKRGLGEGETNRIHTSPIYTITAIVAEVRVKV